MLCTPPLQGSSTTSLGKFANFTQVNCFWISKSSISWYVLHFFTWCEIKVFYFFFVQENGKWVMSFTGGQVYETRACEQYSFLLHTTHTILQSCWQGPSRSLSVIFQCGEVVSEKRENGWRERELRIYLHCHSATNLLFFSTCTINVFLTATLHSRSFRKR